MSARSASRETSATSVFASALATIPSTEDGGGGGDSLDKSGGGEAATIGGGGLTTLVHAVSGPGTGFPAAFVSPASHATHALDATRSFAAHAHVVSSPDASSPPGLVDPPASGARVRGDVFVDAALRRRTRGIFAGRIVAAVCVGRPRRTRHAFVILHALINGTVRHVALGVSAESVVASVVGRPRSARDARVVSTRWFDAHKSPSHTVSPPDASSPAKFELPSHATHAFEMTCSSAAHSVLSQAVSSPEAMSPPSAFVVPGGQALHALPETYSFTPQMISSHVVSIPDASSPPSVFVVPAGHEIHALSLTR